MPLLVLVTAGLFALGRPRRSTGPAVIAEPLRATGRGGGRPHEVSDGQLQRACLARALIGVPRYLVCDEMTSMLDASTGARLVGVIEDHREASSLGVLAISYDEILLRY